MPEIKNNFLQGKMNKDLDERLLQNGQYKDALNIEISTAEDSSVGVAKNILGNKRVESYVPAGFKCVGSIADEKTNKLYWFISSYEKDAILEYNVEQDATVPVVVDIYASNSKAVLKFSGNIITGINIIDNLLFWTDNNSEPKKINIKECKLGTIDDGTLNNHTQLIHETGSFWGMTVDLLKKSAGNPFTAGINANDPDEGRYVFFERNSFNAIFQEDTYHEDDNSDDADNQKGIKWIRHYRNSKFLGLKTIRSFQENSDTSSWNGGASLGTTFRSVPYIPGPVGETQGGVQSIEFKKGDVIFGHGVNANNNNNSSNGITIDLKEEHITVIKPKPLKAFKTKINYQRLQKATGNKPNLFETTFPRFSYRYKYRDGEYSTYAPFTKPVFNAEYPRNEKVSTENANVYYNKDNAYDIKEPHNKAMQNSIHSIELTDFITPSIPENVIEIDILYKKEDSPVIYSVNTIKHIDPEWHKSSSYESKEKRIGYNQGASSLEGTFHASGGLTKGRYVVTSENIYAALPSNQMLRPWDNVPRKALAQEVTGNRIVYGNYLQNYNLQNYQPKVSVNIVNRDFLTELSTLSEELEGTLINPILSSISSLNHENKGLPSVKSKRNYQVGVIYCDKYGRETPVFTSEKGGIYVPWQDEAGNKNASKNNQIEISAANEFPLWVDNIKFFVKEQPNDYYNLVMNRAWLMKKTYDLDNSEGHLWISFPSSDRNKVSENDYITLKKMIGAGQEQVPFENEFKILDISNEPPEAVKFRMINLGVISNGASQLQSFFTDSNFRIDSETDVIKINIEEWKNIAHGIPLHDSSTDSLSQTLGIADRNGAATIYLSWRLLDNTGDGPTSKRYRVSGIKAVGTNEDDYEINLASAITAYDADLAHIDGLAETGPGSTLPSGLMFQIERKELKDKEEFSGSFFVKISKNRVTELVEVGQVIDVTKSFMKFSSQEAFYWRDDIGTSAFLNTSGSGITNYNGYVSTLVDDDRIQDAANNFVGNTHASSSSALRVSDYSRVWEGIHNMYGGGGHWFIDAMHMVAGQSNYSNYAKFCQVTWAGAPEGARSWSYPPPLVWISDWIKNGEIGLGLYHLEENTRYYKLNNQKTFRTSNLVARDYTFGKLKAGNTEPENHTRFTGWVGRPQLSKRFISFDNKNPMTTAEMQANHVNGLEGIVTTTADHVGCRRWYSGTNTDLNFSKHIGQGSQSKIYSSDGEVGRHFMHLSFFAPGKNLIDPSKFPATFSLYGPNSIGENIQGVWGGGHFTCSNNNSTLLGSDSDVLNRHLGIDLEGNLDYTTMARKNETPGPGVGYGYNLDYRELHERQWDPTFNDLTPTDNERLRDFINSIHAGASFKFKHDTSDEPTIYTILNCNVKKLYNHTSWRETYNRVLDIDGNGVGLYYKTFKDTVGSHTIANTGAGGAAHSQEYNDTPLGGNNVQNNGFYTGQHYEYKSVEHQALTWLDGLDVNGLNGDASRESELKTLLNNFGQAHNRRVCYIIELNKNPADAGNFHPLENNGMTAHRGHAGTSSATRGIDRSNADYSGANIEFVQRTESILLHELHKHPAIWETNPKKIDTDLDIYYEASNSIPIKLNAQTNELFAPIGCRVQMLDEAGANEATLMEWNGKVATIEPGFPRGDLTGEFDYSFKRIKFIRDDGSYTIATTAKNGLIGAIEGYKKDFNIEENLGESIIVGLNWYNCFSFNNGIESNRIRDEFNETFISTGVKASTVLQKTYEEERKYNGLIYSGLYNSNSGVNDLNQFIMAEKITKDLNPTFGSIQKLFQRRISLIAFCEDKVISITSNKDTIFNADGNAQLVASNKVLGDATPFFGEYGISKNPESFSSEAYRAYFTDKQRGSVLRLSKDGITPISSAGMHDWFRDNLQQYSSLIGTYDSYKQDYNLSLSHAYGENIITNEFFDEGDESISLAGSFLNHVQNHSISNGVNLRYPWEDNNVLTSNLFLFGGFSNFELDSTVTVTNHAPIPIATFQSELLQETQDIVQVVTTNDPNQPAIETSFDYNDSYYLPANPFPDTASGVLPNNGKLFRIRNFSATSSASSGAADYIPDLFFGSSFSTIAFGQNQTRTLINRYINAASVTNDLISIAEIANSTFQPGLINENVTYNNSNAPIGVLPNSLPNANNTSTTSDPSNSGFVAGIYPTYGAISTITGYSFNGDHSDSIVTSPSRMGTFRVNNTKLLMFDRVATGNEDLSTFPATRNVYSESEAAKSSFYNFQIKNPGNNTPELNELIKTTPNFVSSQNNITHRTIFAGDEIVVTVVVRCWQSSFSWFPLGYNVIAPYFELTDGGSSIAADKFVHSSGVNLIGSGGTQTANTGSSLFTSVGINTKSARWNYANESDVELMRINTDAPSAYQIYNQHYQAVASSFQPTTYQDVGEYISNEPCRLFKLTKGFMGSSVAQFPVTINGPTVDIINGTGLGNSSLYSGPGAPAGNTLNYSLPAHQNCTLDNVYQDYVLTAHFKFKAPNSTAANTNNTSVVVNDLNIKVGQSLAGNPFGSVTAVQGSNTHTTNSIFNGLNSDLINGPGTTPLHPNAPKQGYQFWGVVGVDVTKIAGVVSDYQAQGFINTTVTTTNVTQHARPNVPDTLIPGFCQVQHHGIAQTYNAASGGGTAAYGNAYVYLHAQLETEFGNNVGITSVSQALSNPDGTPNGSASWPTPTTSFSNNQDPQPYPHPKAPTPGAIGAPYVSELTHQNDFWRIRTDSSSARDLKIELTENFVVGGYYLVDIEFDSNANASTGTGGNNGLVSIIGAASAAHFVSGNDVYPTEHCVGKYFGGAGTLAISLIQTTRKEYGNDVIPFANEKIILRALFRYDNDCLIETGGVANNLLKLRFYQFLNEGFIEKIIVKKLTHNHDTGTATNWNIVSNGSSANNNGPHSFSKESAYFQGVGNGELVIEHPANAYWSGTGVGDNSYFYQSFDDYTSSPPTRPAPQTTPGGWKLNFTVNKNPRTNNFAGGVRGFVNNAIGDGSSTEFDGIRFGGIDQVGDYQLYFNMDGLTSGGNFGSQAGALSGTAYYMERNGVLFTNGGIEPYSAGGNVNTAPAAANRIRFTSTPGLLNEFAISNIELVDMTTVYQGGASGGWVYNGFQTSVDDYIIWDEVVDNNTGLTNSRLQFNNMPQIDPFPATLGVTTLISASQQVEETVNRYEKYRISFYHNITSGTLQLYYFNSQNYGFRINNIDSNSGEAFGNNIRYFEQDVEIGGNNTIWNSMNPVDSSFTAELKESFVFRMENAILSDVNGWIDGISMVQVHDTDDEIISKTITYREDAQGWSSFKSFVAENGASVSKNYFTFNEGRLFKHYVPQKINTENNSFVDCDILEATNYNRFYQDNNFYSNIKFVLNQEPSVVKSFNTINYEGSQASIIKPNLSNDVTINNVEAWWKGGGNNNTSLTIDGWHVDSIVTNLEKGNSFGFIKKEGKWFDYIKGVQTTNHLGQNVLNANRSSVQGIGSPNEIESIS